MGQSEGYVDVPGGRVWYRVIGSGEATPEAAAWYKSLMPNASLVVIENGSHLAMWEETDAYIKALREFLNSVEQQEKR